MPVTFGELSTLTTPVSVARFCALLFGCLSFSLASSAAAHETNLPHLETFRIFCMVSWCLFFALTFMIVAIYFVQFHSLLPLSWKNLTATVATLATLMTAAATFAFPWVVASEKTPRLLPREVAAVVASLLTSLSYGVELLLIRGQGGDGQQQQQRGYMATVPGLLKTLQVFGGCVALVLLLSATTDSGKDRWRFWVSGVVYALCLLPALCTVTVMVGDCAGRCLVPYDRLLAGFSLLGVMAYMLATVVCFTRVLRVSNVVDGGPGVALVSETVVASITLLAYTVDLAFSIKLLCDRN